MCVRAVRHSINAQNAVNRINKRSYVQVDWFEQSNRKTEKKKQRTQLIKFEPVQSAE